VDAAAQEDQGFIVNLDGFEGPLDLLLDLARRQKVDLGRISILRLAEQYLAYLESQRAGDLPVAAEYLVMAAWLAYLKSQLLLPPAEREVPDPEAMAGALEERLRVLEGIRRGAAALLARPRLGMQRFPRGAAEGLRTVLQWRYRAGLGELFAAYGAVARRAGEPPMTFPARRLDTVEAALERLAQMLPGGDWRDLMSFLPANLLTGLPRRSAVAASLVASLELARSGKVELQQAAPFAPIMLRRRG
jgi:segregation and condensation protein A